MPSNDKSNGKKEGWLKAESDGLFLYTTPWDKLDLVQDFLKQYDNCKVKVEITVIQSD